MKIKQFFSRIGNWIKIKIKYILTTLGLVGIATVATLTASTPSLPSLSTLEQIKPELVQLENWKANKPTTDAEWLKDVKEESLNVKHDYQLTDMKTDLTNKLPKVQADLDKFTTCPDCIKYDLTKRFSSQGLKDKDLTDMVNGEFNNELAYYTWKTDKISQSIDRISAEQNLRVTKKVDRTNEILGTTYYLDAINGADANAGTATATAWKSLNKFTENARSAGDIIKIRRNTINNGTLATTTTSISTSSPAGVITDLNFTSDGTIVAPIIIEADYDNSWGDFVAGGITANLTFGSTTITMTATTTAVVAGQWIYNNTDNNRTYAYEISTVVGSAITLYLPFKGTTGNAQTMNVMPANPQWNQAAGDFQWNFDTDGAWKVQGIDIRGTDTNGNVEIDSDPTLAGNEFDDCIFTGNGSSDIGIQATDDFYSIMVKKSRFSAHWQGSIKAVIDTYGYWRISDSYIAGSAGNSYAIAVNSNSSIMDIFDLTTTNDLDSMVFTAVPLLNITHGRNVKFSGSTQKIYAVANSNAINGTYMEDYQNIIGANQQNLGLSSVSADTPQIISTSTTVRSGGGATSLELRPTTNLSTNWYFSKIQLFEYPIYADTSNKQYSMYFRPQVATGTLGFGVSPTNSQLWIECEYWGNNATSNSVYSRNLIKSTAVINASSTSWQALSVTCQPAQEGILYLRGWYAKTLETGNSNILLMDVQPQITTP